MTCALYSTPSWFGTVSKSVSAAPIASSWASCENEHVRLRRVGAAEDRPGVLLDETDVVTVLRGRSLQMCSSEAFVGGRCCSRNDL
jgi:hypothetical protein